MAVRSDVVRVPRCAPAKREAGCLVTRLGPASPFDNPLLWTPTSSNVDQWRLSSVAGYEHCQVVTTIDSREAADRLARGAVAGRVAACAQVLGPIASTYRWNGRIESAEEWQVTFKTTTGRYESLEEHIREQHSYDVPEILCSPVIAGNPAYLQWLSAETRGA
jgi:periplasmic divalent cation tolerance protein